MTRAIRVEALWLSVAPLDMRAGMDTLLPQVLQVLGEVRPHHAYVFANRRGTRPKVLIHDGLCCDDADDLIRLQAKNNGLLLDAFELQHAPGREAMP